MCSKTRFDDDSMVGVLDYSAYLRGDTMEYKPIDYQSEGLDEKVIDKILSRMGMKEGDIFSIGPIRISDDDFTPEEIEEFKKLSPPTKRVRAAGPYDAIIRHLTALIGNKNLSDNHRLKYTEDRDYYKARQKEVREERNLPRKRRYWKWIIRDQVRDLVIYINKNHTLKESFDLAARIWNTKLKGWHFQTAASTKNHYWNTYK
jgi:hypothetical protein